MKRFIFRIFVIPVLSVSLLLLFTSCSHIMGYSVLLWNVPEHQLRDGEIVPVYIKSNISHVYVIGIPGKTANETGGKIEVPVWQVTTPESKRRVQITAQKYKEFEHQYASVAFDGLPVRQESMNTSKQVYRLRLHEVVKILYKGKGQPVMSGKTPMKGDWLYVLTKDGTKGWCFSYNLRQLELNADGSIVGEKVSEKEKNDPLLDEVLSKHWYPDYYSKMINSGHIDPALMKVDFGFNAGVDSGTTKLDLDSLHISWPYKGVVKLTQGNYKFTEIPIVMTIKNNNFIILSYTGANGKPEDYDFVTIDDDIASLVETEKERRSGEITSLINFGPVFKSSNYGNLELSSEGAFAWTGYKLLVPSVIPQAARKKGTVSVKYFLSSTLKKQYDGILTFRFDGVDSDINFLYKKESGGLRLEDATGAAFKGSTVYSRGMSPLIMFFAR